VGDARGVRLCAFSWRTLSPSTSPTPATHFRRHLSTTATLPCARQHLYRGINAYCDYARAMLPRAYALSPPGTTGCDTAPSALPFFSHPLPARPSISAPSLFISMGIGEERATRHHGHAGCVWPSRGDGSTTATCDMRSLRAAGRRTLGRKRGDSGMLTARNAALWQKSHRHYLIFSSPWTGHFSPLLRGERLCLLPALS